MLRFKILAIASLISMGVSTNVSAATPKVGESCKKLNQQITTNLESLKCAKFGKKLIWKKNVVLATPKATSSPEPTPSSTPVEVLDPVLVKLQNLIAEVDLNKAVRVPEVNAVIEDGRNGNWPTIATDAANYAVKFYAALGMYQLHPKVTLILGRTQDWMHQQAKTYAPGCLSSNYLFTGNASLCSGNWATVYSHLPDAITLDGRITSSMDLSKVQPEADRPYWPAIPHEIFHTYQQANSAAVGAASDYWPAWFREGSAQVMAYSAYQKLNGGNYLAKLDISSQSSGTWGKSFCTTGLENLKPVCEYTEGFAASEYFVSRFGFTAYIDIFSKPGPSDFPSRFQSATGVTLPDFYKDANQYLKSIGWASAA